MPHTILVFLMESSSIKNKVGATPNIRIDTMMKTMLFCLFVANVVLLSFSDFIYNVSNRMVFPLSVAIVAVVMAVLHFAGGYKRLRPRTEDTSVILFYLGTTVPALVSDVNGNAAPVTLTANFLTMGGIYASSRLSSVNIFTCTKLYLIITSIHSLYALCQFIPGFDHYLFFQPMDVYGQPFIDLKRSTGLCNNPNSYGTFLAMCLCLALVYNLGLRWVPLVILCSVGLLLSVSRESIIGLGAAVVFLSFKRPTRTYIFIILLCIIGSVSYNIIPDTCDNYNPLRFATDENLLVRTEQWDSAIYFIRKCPMLGYGNEMPIEFTDEAYLGWLLTGGIVSAGFWIAGLIVLTLTQPRIRPFLIVITTVGLASNPFSGPTLFLLLSVCGIGAEPAGTEEIQTTRLSRMWESCA